MRPPISVTGHPTVSVDAVAQLEMLKDIKTNGYSVHNATAQSVWAAAEACRKENIPYDIVLLRLPDQRVTSVIVRMQSYTGPVTSQTELHTDIIESVPPRT